jgi:DNA-binding transcriptional regulator LsrR (DeoR family)
MPQAHTPQDRESLLADVAEMYYLEERGQAEIARAIGVTRSMVSRMLKEAREKGIVEVRVRRALQREHDLETALVERFALQAAFVVAMQPAASERALSYIGKAGAQTLLRYLAPGGILGIAWGTTISAAVDALDATEPLSMKIVQLVGALGARNDEYDGHALVMRLAEKLGGEAYYLNAPFLCPNPETAESLRRTQSIRDTLDMGKKAQVALVGIGSAAPQYSSYYLAGYVSNKEQTKLQRAGAVGDVCGIHFDLRGQDVCHDFCARSVTICKEDLFNIPVRIGVAGGPGKVKPVSGALRGGYVNVLVTDAVTARQVLGQAKA